MRYLLAIYGDSSTWGSQSEEETKPELAAFGAFEREAAEAGIVVASVALQPDAYTLSIDHGVPQIPEGAVTEPGRRTGCFTSSTAPAWRRLRNGRRRSRSSVTATSTRSRFAR